jgi:sodium/potassium/calcium exchanger 6
MRSGSGGGEHGQSPYRIMEDMDIVDRLCIRDGSTGYPAYSWVGAWHDGRQELLAHFKEYWIDFMEDEAGSRLEKCLMVLEFPMTIARKVRIYFTTFV